MTTNTNLKAGDPLELTINGVKVVFRYCPPGTFVMGSPEDEAGRLVDETQHKVTLTRGFWMLDTPVTQALWEAVTGENPSRFKNADRPVELVSWEDCDAFIKLLNENDLAPEGLKFDFHTEAEWEYACRAGTTTPFNFGYSLNGDKANCYGTEPYGMELGGKYLGKTTPVKSYPANAWGLYDMHGNVYEWCSDWYGAYPTELVTDPTGSSSGSSRVLRGGSWYYSAVFCRSAYRDCSDPAFQSDVFCLRLVLRSVDETSESTPSASAVASVVPCGSEASSGSTPKAGDPLEMTISGVCAVFRYCPPGTFVMGSPKDEAGHENIETQHEVTLTRGFWILETPVTQALWEAVTGENPSCYEGAERPVENVSWEDCAAFIIRLNEEGYAPEGFQFDFPTEAEWEYSCRAGTTTPFNFGSTLNGDKASCNGAQPYGTDTLGPNFDETTPVKSYPSNAWGLYDMHGNVYEWCSDWIGLYPFVPTTDPTGPECGLYRVSRGGSWYSSASQCRSAYRFFIDPSGRGGLSGLRLVLRSAE